MIRPRDVDALLELAERCEKATAEHQGRLLEDAWEVMAANDYTFRCFATTHVSGFGTNAGWFGAMLDAHAYESAAVMLVPEGDRRWELTTEASKSDPRFGPYQARICIDEVADDPEEIGPQGIANGATPALALCAAALRARSAQS